MTTTSHSNRSIDRSPSQRTLDDDISQLKMENRKVQAEKDKEVAILKQEIAMVKMQLADSHEREENLRQLQNKMLGAFGERTGGSEYQNIEKQLEEAHGLFESELAKIKTELGKQVENLKKENEQLKKELEEQSKKQNYEQEIAQLKEAQQNALENIKNSFQTEQQDWYHEKERLVQQVKMVELKNNNSTSSSLSDLQAKYLQEIGDLNSQLTAFKQKTETEITSLRKERDAALAKTDQKVAKKVTPKKDTSSKQKVKELRLQIQKLEQNERKHKNMMIEMENAFEQDKIEMVRQIKTERQRSQMSPEPSREVDYKKMIDRCSEFTCYNCRKQFTRASFGMHVRKECESSFYEDDSSLSAAMNMFLLSNGENVAPIKAENIRLQQEVEAVYTELKRTKIQLALSDNKQKESEANYKNEIQYLLDKFLKAKNKLKREKQGREDDEMRHNVSMSFVSTSGGGSFLGATHADMSVDYTRNRYGMQQNTQRQRLLQEVDRQNKLRQTASYRDLKQADLNQRQRVSTMFASGVSIGPEKWSEMVEMASKHHSDDDLM